MVWNYAYLTLPVGYDRRNIPSVTSTTDLTALATAVISVQHSREVTGPEIVVAESVASDSSDLADYLSATYLYIWPNSGTRYDVIYKIEHVRSEAGEAGKTNVRYWCRLDAVLTLNVNSIPQRVWSLNRYSPPDSLNIANFNAAPELCDVGRVYDDRSSAAVTWSTDQMCIVMSLRTYLNSGYPDLEPSTTQTPRAFVICDTSYHILTGADAGSALAAILTALGADYNKIYRLQFVPKAWIEDQVLFTLPYLFAGYYYCEVNAPSALLTPVLPGLDISITTGVDNKKAYYTGEAVVTLHRQEVFRSPLWRLRTSASVVGVGFELGYTIRDGLNFYLVVKAPYNGGTVIPIPVPEISVTANGLTTWWEGAKGSVLSSVTSVALTAGATIATQGAAAPALIAQAAGAAGTALSLAGSAEQAARTYHAIGQGSASLYAFDRAVEWLRVEIYRYSSTLRSAVQLYYREHGYSGSWTFNGALAGKTDRSRYYCAAGTVTAASMPAFPCVSIDELVTEANDVLRDGVTFWRMTPVDKSTLGNI